MKRLELRIAPPALTLLSGLIMWALAALLPALTHPWPLRRPVAITLAVLGLVIGLLAIFSFRRARTTLDPHHPAQATALVQHGIYALSRNPMYLGILCLLAGWGYYLGNPLSMLWLPCFIAYLTRYQIIPEERLLQAKFGAAYQAYQRRVRRWV